MPSCLAKRLQEATWVDRAETEFDVTLEYEYFPFDNQLLDTEGADWGYGTRGLTYSHMMPYVGRFLICWICFRWIY
jgi:hypothetical protein